MNKKVIIIGSGPAGMQAALSLRAAGVEPVLVERAEEPGGKLRDWHHLFPSMTPAAEVLQKFTAALERARVTPLLRTEIESVTAAGARPDGTPATPYVRLTDGTTLPADAVIIASGFDIFDARLKEEYGYHIYDNVLTTVDVERMLNDEAEKGKKLALKDGSAPRRIAFVHCVGSRDEKVNQKHCSKVCCVTGVKQAMEMRERFPEAEIYNFYMDIRMFGPGYEELYQSAQQDYGINFIRGRVSEASPTIDGRIQIKAEDTLVGRPMKMTVDMLVLIVGMKAAECNSKFASQTGLEVAQSGFFAPVDLFTGSVSSGVPGVFYAGAATAPKTIGESIAEGAMAAEKVVEYLASTPSAAPSVADARVGKTVAETTAAATKTASK